MKTGTVISAFLAGVIALGTIVAEAQVIDSAVVSAGASPEGLVRRCARHYARNYAQNWTGEATYWRTEKSGNHYDRLFAAKGIWFTLGFSQKAPAIYWDDKTVHHFLRTDACSSLPRIPGTKSTDKVVSVPNPGVSLGIENFLVGYSHSHYWSIYANVRAIELFSPLSFKHIKDYRYKLSRMTETADGVQYEIDFVPVPGRFSQKNRISLSGTIIMKENGRIQRLICHDMIDWFSDYMRIEADSADSVENLSNSELVVDFSVHQERIFVDKVVRHVRWKSPEPEEAQGKKCYSIEKNTYRNPFKYSIETVTEMRFNRHEILTDKEDIAAIRKICPKYAGYAIEFMDVKRRDAEIEPVLLSIPDHDKVVRDVEDCGVGLQEQFDKSLVMDLANIDSFGQFPEEYKKYINDRYEMARHIYDGLFGGDREQK